MLRLKTGVSAPALRFSVLAATFLAFFGTAGVADEPVTWTNAVGVSVTGNSLTKTGTTSDWDAGAASLQVIRDGYGYVELTATETNKFRMLGLSHGDSDQHYSDID